MEIKVEIYWEDKNYSCAWGDPTFGVVMCTAKDIETLKSEFESSLKSQIDDMLADGEEVPEALASGDYEVSYTLAISALLRQAEHYTTLTAIAAATGINQKQIHHYASNVKKPRPAQAQRIVEGIRQIGRSLLAVL